MTTVRSQKTLEKKVSDLKKANADLNAEIKNLKIENKKAKNLEKTNADLVKERDEGFRDRDKLISDLRAQIEKMKEKRGAKFTRKCEQKDDVKKAIEKVVKANLFRTVKFAQPGATSLEDSELRRATEKVFEGVNGICKLDQGPDKMSRDHFVEIYDSHVQKELSEVRQYIQTRTTKAAFDYMDAHNGELPTVEDIENIWDIPEVPEHPEDGELDIDSDEMQAYTEAQTRYARHCELFGWYMNDWLVMAVGQDAWGLDNRLNKLMVDKDKVPYDNSGRAKVLVTVTSEAFGQLMFKNCRTKWLNVWAFKKQHGKSAKPPAYVKDNKDTHKYHGIWSNSRANKSATAADGQVEGAGWHSDGLEYLNARMAAIQTIRQEEAENAHWRMELGRQLIIKLSGLGEGSNGQKKRPAQDVNAQAEGEALAKRVKMFIIDE